MEPRAVTAPGCCKPNQNPYLDVSPAGVTGWVTDKSSGYGFVATPESTRERSHQLTPSRNFSDCGICSTLDADSSSMK